MPRVKVNSEMGKFQAEMLQSVREYKAGKFARKTEVKLTAALQARARRAFSQSKRSRMACHMREEYVALCLYAGILDPAIAAN